MSARPGLVDRVVDGVLSLVAPKRAMVRRHLRMLDNDEEYRGAFQALMRLRGYKSAAPSGNKTGWTGGLGVDRSADGEALIGLASMRSRSRELNRDDAIASGILLTRVNNIVGTGLRPQARTDDAEKNRRIEAVFAERQDFLSPVDGQTYGEHQRTIFRAVDEAGDVLVHRVKTFPDEPVWFEVLEAERLGDRNHLVTPPAMSNIRPAPGNTLRAGVEKDSFGRPVRYWVNKYHPGDVMLPGTPANAFVGEFKPIEAADCRHVFFGRRAGQTRGIPLLQAVMQDLRDLDLLMVAALKRSQIAACLALFIESEQGFATMLDVEENKLGHGYKLEQTIEPGMIFKLYPGEKINTLVPNFPTPELGEFVVQVARRIGAAIGVCWQVVLRDFSGANYSSARADLLETRQGYTIDQQLFAAKVLTWQRYEVLVDARLRGDPRVQDCTDEDFNAVFWVPNGWQWVDPENEAAATEVELRLGITTLRDVCAARGGDWEELLRQRVEERRLERQLLTEAGFDAEAAGGEDAKKDTTADADELERAILADLRGRAAA